MFTLCGLILEARENLFRDFWSLFSISFYFSSVRNYFKKTRTDLRAVSDRDSGPPRLYKPGGSQPEAQPPPSNPSRPSAPPAPPLAVAAAPRRPRHPAAPPPPPTVPPAATDAAALKSVPFFLFSFLKNRSVFLSVFLVSVFLNRSVFPIYLNSERSSVCSF